jgi:hypothetical protein
MDKTTIFRIKSAASALAVGCAALVACTGSTPAAPPPPPQPAPAADANADVTYVKQGEAWTEKLRTAFYTLSQGSELIPLRWIEALKQPNGNPFLADNLSRYGFLRNLSVSSGLPIGVTDAEGNGEKQFGMTCAACHTRQIDVDGRSYRIDGGPANIDFQPFLKDLDTAVGQILPDQPAFKDFAAAVLVGTGDDNKATADNIKKLGDEVQAWYARYHAITEAALPTPAWGPSRLDAVGMILDRLTGLDLAPPNGIIENNLRPANAPTRYPFLWNAWLQKKTQWPGFFENGIIGKFNKAMARNLGQVYGVFAEFHPVKAENPLKIDYLNNNSADFVGLGTLEELTTKMGAPEWRWPLDRDLAKEGEKIYNRSKDKGGCVECHAVRSGGTSGSWWTPVLDVGTDRQEYAILKWKADSGVLSGAPTPTSPGSPPPPFPFIREKEDSLAILKASVTGTISQIQPRPADESKVQAVAASQGKHAPSLNREEKAERNQEIPQPESFCQPEKESDPIEKTPRYCYESRVLKGIWAAAPYLHNGSVPTLRELLKKPEERVASFKLGPAYDVKDVGLAAVQPHSDYILNTTGGCSDERNLFSGNSRCGHDYGTKLSDKEKDALLEYLKSL